MVKKSMLILCAVLGAYTAQAQTQYADKITAVVGDKIILQSDIGARYLGQKKDLSGLELPESEKCGFLRDMIAEKVLVEQAARDSVMVTKDEVESALEGRISDILNYEFGGNKEALEKATGRSIYQIKEDYREPIKDQMISERMKQEVIKNITITPKEVEDYYNTIPEDKRTNIPATVEFGEIVLKPSVDPEVEKYTYDKVADIRRQIVEDGKSFELMAQLYTEDAGKETGGEMNLNRKSNNIDNRFIAAAFKLQPGEISPVFRSSFGYHIIKMVSRNGDDANIRYIVIIPQFTSGDIAKALAVLDSTYNLLSTGKLTFNEALSKVGNDENSKNGGGMVIDPRTGSTILSVDNIQSEDLVIAAAELKVGEYSKPKQYSDPYGGMKCRILYVKSKTDPHQLNLKDDYNILQKNALQMKQLMHLRKWLGEKSKGYYIKIDPNYMTSCDELKMYVK
ncbi:peptidylprolyl isomerase [Edaphocola aurantiacus]|uniref:peptidylprolyl isomerase n=1 Tax=Edaphocola aurantiacus TaxID=2601682 RepID=UPI001C97DC05|nr:peptidylprolyl isomerase [Edaphocola aurantiacus]